MLALLLTSLVMAADIESEIVSTSDGRPAVRQEAKNIAVFPKGYEVEATGEFVESKGNKYPVYKATYKTAPSATRMESFTLGKAEVEAEIFSEVYFSKTDKGYDMKVTGNADVEAGGNTYSDLINPSFKFDENGNPISGSFSSSKEHAYGFYDEGNKLIIETQKAENNEVVFDFENNFINGANVKISLKNQVIESEGKVTSKFTKSGFSSINFEEEGKFTTLVQKGKSLSQVSFSSDKPFSYFSTPGYEVKGSGISLNKQGAYVMNGDIKMVDGNFKFDGMFDTSSMTYYPFENTPIIYVEGSGNIVNAAQSVTLQAGMVEWPRNFATSSKDTNLYIAYKSPIDDKTTRIILGHKNYKGWHKNVMAYAVKTLESNPEDLKEYDVAADHKKVVVNTVDEEIKSKEKSKYMKFRTGLREGSFVVEDKVNKLKAIYNAWKKK